MFANWRLQTHATLIQNYIPFLTEEKNKSKRDRPVPGPTMKQPSLPDQGPFRLVPRPPAFVDEEGGSRGQGPQVMEDGKREMQREGGDYM